MRILDALKIRKLLAGVATVYLESYRRKLKRPRQEQLRLLAQITRELSRTEYGRSLGLRGGETLQEFRSKLRMVGYADIESWVLKQKSTTSQVLVPGKILFFEKTSGSSGPAKYIPYSVGLKRTFGRMVMLWIADILAHGPRFVTGRVFFSVSPAFSRGERTEAGVPVGLDDDSEYLPPVTKWILSKFWVVPPGIKKLQDPEEYRFVLACSLLSAEDLETVSVWNPSYLTAILDFTVKNRKDLAQALKAGKVSRGGLEFRFRPLSAARSDALLGSDAPGFRWSRLWPELKWISCWTDAAAKPFARELSSLFPGVLLQGKGLLATECPVTFPLISAPAPTPLVDEVFYEFLDEQGELKLLDELEDDSEYEVVVSPRGGFARYRLGDRIRTRGKVFSTPCFSFVGRGGQVSDLVGEKLNEVFVRESLEKELPDPGTFYFMLPVRDARPPFYALVIDSGHSVPASRLEEILSRAHHYDYARKLGQLSHPEVWCVPDARRLYYGHFEDRGMKWGDIKHSVLITNLADADAFARKIPPRGKSSARPS